MLSDAEGARAIIIATGSEVALAMDAAAALGEQGVPVRVVSMPCLERFQDQDASYVDDVLPAGVPRLIVEAAHPAPWWRLAGSGGDVLGVERFGMSAPGDVAMAEVGFTVDNVVERVKALFS